jgi:hypothetical protein
MHSLKEVGNFVFDLSSLFHSHHASRDDMPLDILETAIHTRRLPERADKVSARCNTPGKDRARVGLAALIANRFPQAGVQWGEAYAFAEKNNITLVGGMSITFPSLNG